MQATILPQAIILTKYDGLGVYCGLSTTYEVFLIFTTQQYSCLCSYTAIVSYLDKRKVLQQEYL